jgi:hypothetical protein
MILDSRNDGRFCVCDSMDVWCSRMENELIPKESVERSKVFLLQSSTVLDEGCSEYTQASTIIGWLCLGSTVR